jgi:betaine-aldehyde dehydrogenase
VSPATPALPELQNFVAGRHTGAADGRTSEVIDPTTGEAYVRAPVSGAGDVAAAVSAASEAFESWGRSTPAERQRALLHIADAIDARAAEFVAVESKDTGEPLGLTATEEVPLCGDHFRFFAGAARILEGASAGEYMTGYTSFVRREPVGVIGQVTPWNYPLMMAVWKIAPALAAGNTVVLKPSDTTPASTLLLAEVAAEFLPPGVLNIVCGDRDTGRALVDHPRPDMVSITGSVRAGMEVASSAARDVKRVHLELGGKAPVIVFADADLGAAAEGSRWLGTSTPARTALQRPASSCTPRCTTTSWPRSPSRRAGSAPGCPTTRRWPSAR